MKISWIVTAAALISVSSWYASGPGSAYSFGVEFGCVDAAWRRGQEKPCGQFEWQRTMRFRVDVANNRVVALPGAGWFASGPTNLTECSVYDQDTWRCRDSGSHQTMTAGQYLREGGLAGYTEYGSTRLFDVARYMVGAPPPNSFKWRAGT
ncbi:hypothetical protein AFCDBAGC_0677 [Methylobacterium cerastii]|uniref:Uncharacterized protein n=1 Tax=Methylobacterium cerastii TaxID=932741 RepID=A0ABQ4QDC9_9HYPH|nr:hypothetical protein [Methylobacterium cerastii]GJD42835.1 hypothetical protein AFCDBAGC_0677 [Methylobacterium cerastii]